MQIVELKVNVEKSQLAQLEAQVKALNGRAINIKVNAQGLQGINKNMTQFVNAMAKYQGASAKIASANAKLKTSENRLAVAQQKTAQTANQKAAAHSRLLTQMQRTQTAERNLQTQIQKTNTERQRSVTQAGKVRAEEVRLQQQMERTRRVQEQSAKGAQIYGQNMQRAGKEVSGFQRLMGGSLGQLTAQMFAWQALGAAVSVPIRAMKEALSTMKEVDSQLVVIQKTTNFTGQQMKEIEQQAYKTASAYGQSADSYLESVAAFARAGYKEQSSQLGELAVKTMLVGDTTAEIADQFLLSVDKAYKYNGSITELMKVLDGADYINNNYATSIEKIAEGMGLVAPVAAQAHVGVDELMAALGTITAITQRSGSEAARALRALFLNILGDTKTEIEDGATWTAGEIEGLRDVLREFAPEVVKFADETKTVINPMEAMAALSKAMTEGVLTEQKLMEMVSDIGGKLRTSQLLAIIQNWDMYESMLADYQTAAGTADKEIEHILNSWESKVNIMKNTWTEFVSHMVETDTIKGALDGVTSTIELLDSDIGQATLKFAGFAAGALLASRAITGIGKAIAGTHLANFVSALAQVALGSKAASSALTFMGKDLVAALFNPVTAVAAAIVGMAVGMDAATVSFKEQSKAIEELEGQYESLYGAGSEYAQLMEGHNAGTLNQQEERRYQLLKLEADEMERQLQTARELAQTLFNQEYGDKSNRKLTRRDKEGNPVYETNEDEITKDVQATRDLKKAQDDLSKSYTDGKSNLDDYRKGVQDLLTENKFLYDTYSDFKEWGLDITPAQEEFLDFYNWMLDTLGAADTDLKIEIALNGLDEATVGVGEFAGKVVYDSDTIKKALEEVGLSAEEIDGVIADLEASGAIVIDVEADDVDTTIQQLEDLGIAVRDLETGEIRINTDALGELADILGISQEQVVGFLQKLQEVDGVSFSNAEGEIVSVDNALLSLSQKSPMQLALTVNNQASPEIQDATNKAEEYKNSNPTTTVRAINEASPEIQNALNEGDRFRESNPSTEISVSNEASPEIQNALNDGERFRNSNPRTEISVIDNATSVIQRAVNALKGFVSKTIEITTNYVTTGTGPGGGTWGSGNAGPGPKAAGDVNFQGGRVLLGDELSPDGSPRPELVIRRSGDAFLAGVNGPVVTTLPAGARIFNYKETMGILSGEDVTKITAFASGLSRGGLKPGTSSSLWREGRAIRSGTSTMPVANKPSNNSSQKASSGSSSSSSSSGSGSSSKSSSSSGSSNSGSSKSGSSKSSSGGNSSSGSEKDEYLESLKKQLEVLEAQYSFLDASDAETEDLIAKSREIQTQLHVINDYLRATGGEEKDIWDNSAKWHQELKKIRETQKKVYEDQRALLESELSLYEKQGWSIDDQLAKIVEIQGVLEEEAEFLREIGAEQVEINAVSLDWMVLQEKRRELERSVYQNKRNELEIELELYEAQGWSVEDRLQKLKEIQKTLEGEAKYLREIGAAQSEINQLSIEWMAVNDQIREMEQGVYQDRRSELEIELKMYEAQNWSASDKLWKLKEIQKTLEDEANYLRSIGAAQSEVNELSIQWMEVNEQILQIQKNLKDELDRAVSKELKEAQEKRDAEIGLIDKQIDKLKEAREVQEDQLELEEKRKKVEEARFALENAQNERTVRFFNKEKNQWEWGADPNQVKSAKESLENAKEDLDEYLDRRQFEAQIKALEDQKALINNRYDALEERWDRLTEIFDEPIRDIRDILQDLLDTGAMNGAQIDTVQELVGEIKTYTGNIFESVSGRRTSATARAADGSTYNIGSKKGIDFINNAPRGATMTGGDGSTWAKNTDLSTTITKNGKSYTVGGNVQYDIGSDRGLDFIRSAEPGDVMIGGDGSEWTKHPDGSVTIFKNGTTYTVAPNAFWNNGNRTAVSADGERYLIGSKKGLDFINGAEYGQTMTGGDGSLWEKMANGSTKITKNDKTFTVYDGGGILSGLGGIKWTGGDEMILPPDLTDYMLRPTADSRFVERMNELRYIYGNKSLTNSLMSNKNQSSQDHYGDVYTFGDVTMTEEKAKSTTVYELAQLSRSLGIYKNS